MRFCRKAFAVRSKFKALTSLINGFIKDKEKPKADRGDDAEAKSSPFAALGNLLKKRREASRDKKLALEAEAQSADIPLQDYTDEGENANVITDGESLLSMPSILDMIGFLQPSVEEKSEAAEIEADFVEKNEAKNDE